MLVERESNIGFAGKPCAFQNDFWAELCLFRHVGDSRAAPGEGDE
jgi:hypothetical protein